MPPFKAEPEEMVEMLYTGGTTGLPKGVPFTNILFLEAAAEQRAVSERFIPKGKDIVVQGGPLFHILGQASGSGRNPFWRYSGIAPQGESGRAL